MKTLSIVGLCGVLWISNIFGLYCASLNSDNDDTIHLEISAEFKADGFRRLMRELSVETEKGSLATENVVAPMKTGSVEALKKAGKNDVIQVPDDASVSGYIIGGEDAEIEAFPWQCSMRLWGSHRCGCSLIHPQYVLTAAHCNLDPVQGLQVVLGSNELYSDDGVYYDVSQKIVHPDFIFDPWVGMPNDMMLLKLKQPVDVSTPNIAVVKLPEQGQDFMGTDCRISGWGAIEFSPWLSPHPTLQEATVKPTTNQACINAFDADSITAKQICTIHDVSTPCAGDSGGPLVCKIGGTWQQAGVVSWGEDCRTDLPAVYTRVSEYRDWLKKEMQPAAAGYASSSNDSKDADVTMTSHDRMADPKLRRRILSRLSFVRTPGQ